MSKLKLVCALLAVIMLSTVGFALPPQPTAPDLEVLARELTQQLAAKDFAKVEDHFNAEMVAAMSEPNLASTWEQILAKVGPFESIEGTTPKTQMGYHVVLVTTKFEKTTINLKWVFDKKNQVTGFFLVPLEKTAAAPTPAPAP